MSRSGASEIQSASSSPFAEATGTASPEKLKSKEDPVRAELWLLVIIFSLSLLLLNTTFLSRNLPLSAPIRLFALLISHPVGSKYPESKSSVYPQNIAQLQAQRIQSINTEVSMETM